MVMSRKVIEMNRQKPEGRGTALRKRLTDVLSARWWIGIGVCITAIGLVPLFCSDGRQDPEWQRKLRTDLEQLPDEPANHLRVARGGVLELGPVDRFLFHSLILEQDSTLKLTDGLPVQELRAERVELRPGASIQGVGRPGLPGESGSPGAKGGKCTRGQDGTDGTSGKPGGDGLDIRIETLELVLDGSVTIDTSAGAGGSGGAGGAGGRGGRGDRSDLCDGGDGGSGGSGGDGGSGGSAGDLHIRFAEVLRSSGKKLSPNDLARMVAHVARLGKGGEKGEGGAGGAGGPGQGANILGVSADAGSRGSNGESGDRGNDGDRGRTTLGDTPAEQVP